MKQSNLQRIFHFHFPNKLPSPCIRVEHYDQRVSEHTRPSLPVVYLSRNVSPAQQSYAKVFFCLLSPWKIESLFIIHAFSFLFYILHQFVLKQPTFHSLGGLLKYFWHNFFSLHSCFSSTALFYDTFWEKMLFSQCYFLCFWEKRCAI